MEMEVETNGPAWVGMEADGALEADVVVVGAGIAGVTAALSAAELGLGVVLVEKLDQVGGSSVMSGGFFAFSGTAEQAEIDEADSEQLFRDDLVAAGGGVADTALIDAYLAGQRDAYDWLKAHGTVFDEIELSSGQSARRSHHADIAWLVPHLADELAARGGRLLLGAPVGRLLTDGDGRVTGVETGTEAAGKVTRIAARRGVVLASGGFSRGTDLLRTFAPDQLQAIPYGGLGNTGDGLRLAWRLGAGMADMGSVAATYGSHPETGPAFHELLTAYYLGAIIVNVDGERFVDESKSYKVLGREVLRQPEGIGFQIFDSVVRAKSVPGIPLVDIDMLERIGHLHRADTLPELAGMIGVDEQALMATVARYNDSVAGRQVDDFGRMSLCNGVGERLPVQAGPFYAYEAKALMTTTYAGITTTPWGQVRRIDGTTISGLYAIGELVGGFHGQAYMTGTSLGKGAVFGRIVARELAGRHEPAAARIPTTAATEATR